MKAGNAVATVNLVRGWGQGSSLAAGCGGGAVGHSGLVALLSDRRRCGHRPIRPRLWNQLLQFAPVNWDCWKGHQDFEM